MSKFFTVVNHTLQTKMAKHQHKKGEKKDSKPQQVITDSRFASVHTDPRFKTPNVRNLKVKVDDRFSRKELEKLNAGSSGKRAAIDRYGRKIKDKESNFDKYFQESEESDDSEENGSEGNKSDESLSSEVSDGESGDDDSDEQELPDTKAKTKETFVDRARGEGVSSESDSESDSEESESEEEVESDIEVEQGKPEEGDPSDTFAVVNMDWDNLKAVDLMATFQSFVPKNGLIKSITIYPSEFGKEQMQKEEVEGPPKELFKKKSKKKAHYDDSDSDSDIDTNNAADMEKAARKLYEEDNGEEDYDSKALRRYQLQRLRYYYAVVNCDSVATAKNIYDNCDGTEYESTANIFDLRYVPQGMEFDDSEAKEVCTKIPSNYKPSTVFVTDALHHSKVKLTWDETPKERLAVAGRLFSQKEIDDMDFKAYLASESEDEDEEQQSAKDKYKQLLGGRLFDGKADENSDDDVDMEITFTPGLSDQAAKAKKETEESEANGEESTISAYKRKQKERRKARMEKFKQEQKSQKDPASQSPPATETKKDKSKKSNNGDDKDEDKSRADLELLMMNEEGDEDHEHFDMRDIIKSEKKKSKKSKKSKHEEAPQQDFEVDLNDPRFQEIFENRDYSIDPTSSDFKQTKTMKKILDERSKRLNTSSQPSTKKHKPNPNELNTLVDKLKRKHKK